MQRIIRTHKPDSRNLCGRHSKQVGTFGATSSAPTRDPGRIQAIFTVAVPRSMQLVHRHRLYHRNKKRPKICGIIEIRTITERGRMSTNLNPKFTSTTQAGTYLGVTPTTVINLCNGGKIPFLKLGGKYLIAIDWLESKTGEYAPIDQGTARRLR